MIIKTIEQLYNYVTGLLNLDKKLTELPELPENYEFSGNEFIYIVADDGKDYKIANKNIVIPQLLSKADLIDGKIPIEQIPYEIINKADLVDGKVPIEQIPELGIITAADLTGAEIPQLIKKAASDNVRNYFNQVLYSSDTDYVKVKTIKFTKGLIGQVRVKFNIYSSVDTKIVYAKLKKNGVDIGSVQSTSSVDSTTKSQDITTNWNPNDTCELWVKANLEANVYVGYFKICYDDAPTVAVPSENS